ncbi:Peptidase M23 [Haloferax mucosum ATCC BAA-1512]|uniref:Peptidase M23 n=1 Tax=Haloferax mucosum ATCC BAA-1512 TaxID=662479 RepID=M0IGF2_9EURY|nr:Peptidase M23 [Haloferax mucosum ATCC BAA-1512]
MGFIGFLGDAFPQLEVLTLFHLFWLFALWPFASMLCATVKQSLGFDEGEKGPRDWLEMNDGWRGQVAFLLGVPLSVLNPWMFRQDVMQLFGSLVAGIRHRGSLPAPDTYTQATRYRLPVDGTWTVVNGSPIKAYSHSWFPATQRYAYDFVITDESGRSRPEGTDSSTENYYCYDEPVLAPASGVVVAVHDSDPELKRAGGLSHPLKRSLTGNCVMIRHANMEYSCLAHLIPGSIEVEPGDTVECGEQIGRCGHSGNSSEPHLHFQLQDHPAFEVAAGLPVRFDDVTVDTPGVDVVKSTDWTEPEGGPGSHIHVGQRVSHVPEMRSGESDTVGDSPDATDTSKLSRVGTLSRVATGLSLGGFVTAVVGVVAPSRLTVVLALAVLATLGLVYQVVRQFSNGGHVRLKSLSQGCGVGMAAMLLAVSVASGTFSSFSSLAVGAGVFTIGFVLYTAVWEYGRWSLV